MRTTWLFGLLLLSGCARFTAHKADGTGVAGVFESYQKGLLAIKVRGKDASDLIIKHFTIEDSTPVTVFHGDEESALPAKTALVEAHAGTPTIVRIDRDGKVIGVQLGLRERKRDK